MKLLSSMTQVGLIGVFPDCSIRQALSMLNDYSIGVQHLPAELLLVLELWQTWFYVAMVLSLAVLILGFTVIHRKEARRNKQMLDLIQMLKAFSDALSEERAEVVQLNKRLSENQKLRDKLTQMLVHDLKSPLQSIVVANQLNDSNLKDLLIRAAARHMNLLIQNILDVQKYQGSRMPTALQEVEVASVAGSAVELVSALLKMKDQDVNTDVEQGLRLTCDPELLLRVLVNLLHNAHKHGPAMRPLRVNAAKYGGGVCFTVTNEGPPIPAEARPHLFHLYETFTQSATPYSYSTGIGLAFCRMAVEAQGGRIGFESPLDGPVSFWFVLPETSEEGD